MGLSPLLCAFKNHGNKIAEDGNTKSSRICNLSVIDLLLNAGANPFQVCSLVILNNFSGIMGEENFKNINRLMERMDKLWFIMLLSKWTND